MGHPKGGDGAQPSGVGVGKEKMAWVFCRGPCDHTSGVGAPIAPALARNESSLISKINAERSSCGIATLQVYWDQTEDARAQAKRTRDEQGVFHHPNLGSVTTDWTLLGENVAVGGRIVQIMDAVMDSLPHRSHILNSNHNYASAGSRKTLPDTVGCR